MCDLVQHEHHATFPFFHGPSNVGEELEGQNLRPSVHASALCYMIIVFVSPAPMGTLICKWPSVYYTQLCATTFLSHRDLLEGLQTQTNFVAILFTYTWALGWSHLKKYITSVFQIRTYRTLDFEKSSKSVNRTLFLEIVPTWMNVFFRLDR